MAPMSLQYVRIATFNLENLDDGPEVEPPLSERIPILAPALARLSADILCLQEINGQEVRKHSRELLALDKLLAGSPYVSFYRSASEFLPGHGPADHHNLVTLSRFPILEQRCIRHSLVAPPLYQRVTADPPEDSPMPVEWERPVLYSLIELPTGRKLHIINVHLKAPLAANVPGQKLEAFVWKSTAGWAEGMLLSAIKRAGQAFEVRLFIDQIFDEEPDALVVVAGDLNAGMSEMPGRLLAANIEDTGNGHLARKALVAVERSVPETLRFSVVHAGKRVMLDHLLVSKSMLAHFRQAEVHNEALGDELSAYMNVRASPESYHAPVVAQFEMEMPEDC